MKAIAHIDAGALRPGVLGQYFRKGAAAVVIRGDRPVHDLWARLLAEPRTMPWVSSLYELAANLLPDDDLTNALGDLYYFKPNRHSYIARKIEISLEGMEFTAKPDRFRIPGKDIAMSAELMRDCWTFATSILVALGPTLDGNNIPLSYRVAVQRLKYHDSYAGHEALFRMVRNSLGPWARLGYLLDRRREEMHGFFARRGLCDILALLSLLPFLHSRTADAGALAPDGKSDRDEVPAGTHVIVKAHVDTRYFSALSGTRHNLRTEILAGGRWLTLPIDCGNMAVLPGSAAMKAYGIAPTVHRVLQEDGPCEDSGDPALRNVTLLLGTK